MIVCDARRRSGEGLGWAIHTWANRPTKWGRDEMCGPFLLHNVTSARLQTSSGEVVWRHPV